MRRAFRSRRGSRSGGALAAGIAAGIVALQSVWLLPVLDARVATLLAGGTPPAGPYHVLYIGLDCVKLVALLVVGVLSLRAGMRAALSSAR